MNETPAIGNRVRFNCPGHYRHGDFAEVLMIGKDERAGMVAIGFELADSMGMWWCEPRHLEPAPGVREDAYRIYCGDLRT